MSSYLFPIKTAIIVFLVLATMITLPYLAYKYYKQGSLPFFQGLIEGSFVFYMLAAFFLTLLPLPSHEYVDALTTPRVQLVPFAFIQDFLKHTVLVLSDPNTYVSALKQGVVTQPLFNIVMTIPFGVYLRYYFKKPLKYVVIASFLLSIFYEITQLTGIYGYYSRSYRLFDVDDLFLNTLGGLIGYVITPFVVYLFPSRSKIDQDIKIQAKTVSLLRRFVAYLLDEYIMSFLLGVITLGVLGNGIIRDLVVTLVLICFVITFNGQTLGLKLVRVKVVSDDGSKLTLRQAILRYGLFYLFIQAGSVMLLQGFNFLNEFAYENVDVLIFYLGLMLTYFAVIALHFIVTIFKGRRQFFYERASKTHLESTLK